VERAGTATLEYLGSAIRVDHRQYPRVYRLFAEAAATLDVTELPELYVQYDRSINGMCIGMSKPFIVINSGSLELLDDEELRTLLGHEIGHLLSGHAVYQSDEPGTGPGDEPGTGPGGERGDQR
jgi:Zn-dependent protease with chaperone function